MPPPAHTVEADDKWGPFAPAEELAAIILFLCLFLCIADTLLLWWRQLGRERLRSYLEAFEAHREARRRAAYATELVHLEDGIEMMEGLTSGDAGDDMIPPWRRPSLSDDEVDDTG